MPNGSILKQTNQNYIVSIKKSINSYFFIEAFIGSNSQALKLIVDTTSDWTIINSQQCTECPGFSSDSSSSFQRISSSVDFKISGGFIISGYESLDKISLNKTTNLLSADRVQFFYGSIEDIPNDVSGVLGLSRKMFTKNAPLFLDQLFIENKITQRIFAIYLESSNQEGIIEFGSYSPNMIKKDIEIAWVYQEPSQMWSGKVFTVRIGDYDNNYFAPTGFNQSHLNQIVMTSTTQEEISIPFSIYDDLIKELLRNRYHIKINSTFITSCNTKAFQSIFLNISFYLIELPPSSFLTNVTNDKEFGACKLNFKSNKLDYWILGTNLLKNYYMIHDLENQRLGFVPHIYSEIGPIYKAPPYYMPISQDLPAWQIAIYVGIGALAATGIGIIIYYIVTLINKNKSSFIVLKV